MTQEAVSAIVPEAPVSGRPTAIVGRWAARIADRLNPILIKEARQALKSRQFVLTFALLLVCAWIWSILGIAMAGPSIHYSAAGPTMFFGYYVVLAFPLLVVVPYGAFQSISAEQQDRTYELLSITALSPQQIVSGKLASAAMQMAVYLSAIMPCLGFTYMLRGIDLVSVLLILGFTVLGSFGLAMLAVLIGTLATHSHWQAALAVGVIVGLLSALGFALQVVQEWVRWGGSPGEYTEFWIGMAAIMTAYASYFALAFYAAAARLTFASENRSTRLRVVLVIQQALLVGWFGWLWLFEEPDPELLMFVLCASAAHWFVMGSMMVGESPALSLRVRRNLPQSTLGRALFTWLNPGPGTGYVLAVSSLLAVWLMIAMGILAGQAYGGAVALRFAVRANQVLLGGIVVVAYVAFYLGMGTLILRGVRRVSEVTMLLPILIQTLLLLLGCGMPVVIQMMTPSLRYADYTLLQLSNPFWTLAHMFDGGALPPETPWIVSVVPAAAGIVLALNLPGIAGELRNVRVAKPARVAEEDDQLAAARRPPQPPRRQSPWDDE
jgi:hypothetical protein